MIIIVDNNKLMDNERYLYGAAVQGIQNFIFQTNELKDIVGASELVSNICGRFFAELLYGECEDCLNRLNEDTNSVLYAAGNVKYIFTSRNECERIVREFPRLVLEKAPGITISQAVVEYKDEMTFSECVNILEEKLRAQRNLPMRSTLLGKIGIKRSRSTGLPAVYSGDKNNLFQDKATISKKEADRNVKSSKLCIDAFGEDALKFKFPYNIGDITDRNNWIAVIHADGNGLGQVVQKIGSNPSLFKRFSRTLDEVTKKAAQSAFKDIELDESWKFGDIIPIRPIVLGGDDLTVICRGYIAMDYVKKFIQYFKNISEEELGGIIKEYNTSHKGNEIFGTGETCLTACAGIAFIKANFPFYYGYELAEALCSVAKKVAKSTDKVNIKNGLPASCLMFHKVQDSFVEDYDDIKRRELLPEYGKSFQFGPYFLNDEIVDGYWSIDKLNEKLNYIESNNREKNFIKSAMRNWLTNVHDSFEMADQILKSTQETVYNKSDSEYIKEVTSPVRRCDGTEYYPTFDILSLISVHQSVKNRK